ncbi:MAG: hypothetical protein U1D30_22370 [Planctomycetota bacterium]
MPLVSWSVRWLFWNRCKDNRACRPSRAGSTWSYWRTGEWDKLELRLDQLGKAQGYSPEVQHFRGLLAASRGEAVNDLSIISLLPKQGAVTAYWRQIGSKNSTIAPDR